MSIQRRAASPLVGTRSPKLSARHVAMIAIAALALASCAADDGGSDASGDEGTEAGADTDDVSQDEIALTFAWWGDASRAERYEQSVALFEQANPHITVQTSFAGWGDYWSARSTEAAGGSLPDVMQMDIAYLTEYGSHGQIAALDEHVGQEIDITTLSDAVVPAGQIDGNTYAVTTGTNTLATFINTDLLDELGVAAPDNDFTWESFHDFLREVAAAGENRSPQVYGSVDYTRIFWLFQIWLGQQGLQMFTDDGQLGFSESDLARWWAQTEDLRAEDVLMPHSRLTQLDGIDAIGAQEVAAEISWDNFLVRFSEGSGGAALAMFPPPADDLNQRGLFLKPSLMLARSATTDHPAEAAALIDFILNDAEVSQIFGTSRGVPASTTAQEAVVAEGLDADILEYEASIEPLLTETPPPPVSGFGSLEEAFVRIHEEVAFGNATPEEAAAQWFAEADTALGG